MKKQFHEDFYKSLEKCTKQELIEKLEDWDKRLDRMRWKLDCSGFYSIKIFKNKKLVNTLDFTWDDNPHGCQWDDIKDLAQNLMNAYQDYESLVETEIIIKDDWDERI